MLNLRNTAYPCGTIVSHNGEIEETILWDLTRTMREAQEKKAAKKPVVLKWEKNKLKIA